MTARELGQELSRERSVMSNFQKARILGMPRRMAYFDFGDPAIAPQALSVTLSAIGGLILLASCILFLLILADQDGASFGRP